MNMSSTRNLLQALLFRLFSNPKSTAAGIVAIVVAVATDLGYAPDPDKLLEVLLYGFGAIQLLGRDVIAKKQQGQ